MQGRPWWAFNKLLPRYVPPATSFCCTFTSSHVLPLATHTPFFLFSLRHSLPSTLTVFSFVHTKACLLFAALPSSSISFHYPSISKYIQKNNQDPMRYFLVHGAYVSFVALPTHLGNSQWKPPQIAGEESQMRVLWRRCV